MSGHTPGPWSASKVTGGWSVFAPDLSEYSAEGDLNCLCDYLKETDARLIAAAPELLAALKDSQSYLCAEYCADEHISFCREASVAISKAEGGSPND